VIISEPMRPLQRPDKAETIDLGSFHLVDEFNEPLVAAQHKSRRLLPVPSAGVAAVAEADVAPMKERRTSRSLSIDSGK
jgi:hypothetical protein